MPSTPQLDSAVAFTRDANGRTVGTFPPIRVEGPTDADAIRAMLDIAESIRSGCTLMLLRCNKMTGVYEGSTVPVQPFIYKREEP